MCRGRVLLGGASFRGLLGRASFGACPGLGRAALPVCPFRGLAGLGLCPRLGGPFFLEFSALPFCGGRLGFPRRRLPFLRLGALTGLGLAAFPLRRRRALGFGPLGRDAPFLGGPRGGGLFRLQAVRFCFFGS